MTWCSSLASLGRSGRGELANFRSVQNRLQAVGLNGVAPRAHSSLSSLTTKVASRIGEAVVTDLAIDPLERGGGTQLLQ